MQLRYVFSELGQGLRRNLSMHLAVILTLFVSLTLVGLGVLLNAQAKKAEDHWGNQLQITVFLCNDNRDAAPLHRRGHRRRRRTRSPRSSTTNPEVETYHSESKQEAYDKAKELFGEEYLERPRRQLTGRSDMAESLWIELKDPEEFEGVTSAVQGLDGVSHVRDLREVLKPIYAPSTRSSGARSASPPSCSWRRCCWWPTRSGWRRSRDAARSASCAWSAPPASTSRCRSCSRRWSPR